MKGMLTVQDTDPESAHASATIPKAIRVLVLELLGVVTFVQSILLSVYEWVRMWWLLLPMKGPFDKVPLVWNLVFHFAITSDGPELDYNVGVFNMVDGLFFQLRRFKVFKVYLGFTPLVFVTSAEGVAKILSNTTNISKSVLYDMLEPWMGNGLLTGSGPSYRMRRKLITPAFHFKFLDVVLPIMEKHAGVFCSRINGVVDALSLSQVLGLDIITETAMGIELNAQLKPDEPYVSAVYRAANSHMSRTTRPWLWNDFIFYLSPTGRQFKTAVKEMHKFVDAVIADRVSELKNDPSRATHSFLDALISMHFLHPIELSTDAIKDEVNTFMFAGHDTTSAAVAFSLYLMGLHPEVQSKVHEELDRVFLDAGESATSDKLRHLHYLEAVIKEALRLYPSAPIIARRIDKEVEIGGHTIPRGATVNLFSYGLHRDPKYFPEPEEFRPERFLRTAGGQVEDSMRQLPPFAYFPFSGGMRNCVGQKFAMIELKTVLSTVMRRFRLRSLHKRDELELAIEVIVRPRNGLLIEFRPREGIESRSAKIQVSSSA